MEQAINHERLEQVKKAFLMNMPEDITRVLTLFSQRKLVAKHIIDSTDDLQLIELNKLFDHANDKLKDYLALG